LELLTWVTCLLRLELLLLLLLLLERLCAELGWISSRLRLKTLLSGEPGRLRLETSSVASTLLSVRLTRRLLLLSKRRAAIVPTAQV